MLEDAMPIETAAPPVVSETGTSAARWKAAAVHQAGHVVVAHALDEPVLRTGIWHTDTRDRVSWEVSGHTHTVPTDATVGLLIAVAGVEAVALLTGAPTARLRAEHPADLQRVDLYRSRARLSEADARTQARLVLQQRQDTVEQVAAALVRVGALDGPTLAEVLDNAWTRP
jgi:hypothetical protein